MIIFYQNPKVDIPIGKMLLQLVQHAMLKGGRLYSQSEMKLYKKPFRPTVDDLHENGRNFPPNFLHESWMDYLYWDVELLP